MDGIVNLPAGKKRLETSECLTYIEYNINLAILYTIIYSIYFESLLLKSLKEFFNFSNV